jgi:tetratricopeptide (TPR) repeat protein
MMRFPRLLVLLLLAGSVAQAADEKWITVTAGPFTVLTSASEKAARKWAFELERFHRGLQGLVPVPLERLSPVTVVLFKNDRAMEPYVPLENSRPAKLGGLFVRTNDLNTIMLSLTRDAEETRHVVFHEAVHWHLAARGDALPLWLGEGLAELYATFESPDAGHERFATPLAGHLRLLRLATPIPISKLLATDRTSLLYNERARGNIFYAESWALAHLLFFADGSPGLAGLDCYLVRLKTGAAPEEAFKAEFGDDFAALEARLRRYVPAGIERARTGPRAADTDAALVVREAGRIEVELAKGALLLGARGPAAAEAQLLAVTEMAPRDPRGWELRGIAQATQAMAALDAKAMDAAAAHFRRAIECDPSRVPAYEGLAGMIYSMATFAAEDAARLARGLALAPANRMIEVGAAAAEMRSDRRAAGRVRLERICALDPAGAQPATKFARQILDEDQLRADLAEIEKLAGDNRYPEVLAIADRALARDLDPASRKRMADLRRRMGDFKQVVDAMELVSRGNPAAAKKLLFDLIATNPDKAVVGSAVSVLTEIERGTRTELR